MPGNFLNADLKNVRCLIVGAGPIAQEYAKVLRSLEVAFEIVCRKPEKADALRSEFNVPVASGGVGQFIQTTQSQFSHAINAVDIDSLFEVNKTLISSGKCGSILAEKPGAVSESEFKQLSQLCADKKVQLSIAYSRRHFSSVLKLKEILRNQKNTSLFFEFTEWFWRINPAEYSAVTLKEWLLCNSSHVLDLAFFLGDGVEEIHCSSKRSNPKAVTNTQYVGHGTLKNGALFSYIADWESAGRWKVEASTAEGRYMLCPLEKLFFQKRGTLEYVEVAVDASDDERFKPGFLSQTRAFVMNDFEQLKSIEQQIIDLKNYKKVQGESH